ncbi:MAG: hypothetical protein ACXIVO_03670 [Glycocaulis sp.]
MDAPVPGAGRQALVEALELDQVEKREKAKAKAKGDEGCHEVCSILVVLGPRRTTRNWLMVSIACVAYPHQYALPQFSDLG